MKIVVVGGINMDIVSRVKAHARPGETIKSQGFLYLPGGKGANQAIAAHRLGGSVSLLGKVGQDAFGKELLEFFKSEGLDASCVLTAKNIPTGAAFVAVDESSQNLIYVSAGANNALSPADIENITIEPSDILSATLETPLSAIRAAFEKARAAGAATVLNAAPALLEAKELFFLADYLILNETELGAFAHAEPPASPDIAISLMKKLRTDTSHDVITTLGAEGVVALIGGETIQSPGHKVDAVDTTAAGDCFVGAFITAFQEGKTPRTAMEFANAAAALSVQKVGASSSLPHRAEVDAFLAGKK